MAKICFIAVLASKSKRNRKTMSSYISLGDLRNKINIYLSSNVNQPNLIPNLIGGDVSISRQLSININRNTTSYNSSIKDIPSKNKRLRKHSQREIKLRKKIRREYDSTRLKSERELELQKTITELKSNVEILKGSIIYDLSLHVESNIAMQKDFIIASQIASQSSLLANEINQYLHAKVPL